MSAVFLECLEWPRESYLDTLRHAFFDYKMELVMPPLQSYTKVEIRK